MRVLSQNFWVFRSVKTPFSPFSRYKLEKNVLVLFFLSFAFPSPCTMRWMGTYTPSSLQCVHFRNVFPPAPSVRAFSKPLPSAFESMQRGYCLISCYSWTRSQDLFFCGYSCAQLSTVVASSPSLSEKNVRERLVRVLALDPTVSVQSQYNSTW